MACFKKSAAMIKLLVSVGANVNIVGEWTYAPVNMLFIDYSAKVKLLSECHDEWLITRLV